MLSYEEIKTWLEDKENKQKLVYGVCFVLVFLIGFGAGKFDNQISKNQSNYTIKPAVLQTTAKTVGEKPIVAGTSTPGSCLIKGNINSKGQKIYHVLGGAFYKIVKPEQCFASEADAQAAGFVKSGR